MQGQAISVAALSYHDQIYFYNGCLHIGVAFSV